MKLALWFGTFAIALVANVPRINAETLAPRQALSGILAARPPMGWNPFNAFRLDYDEGDVMAAARAMVRTGLAKDGYRYINIDDGWWLRREPKGILIRTNLYPSAHPTSLQPFVDQLHAIGLKAGIYTDIGYNTCSQRWEKTTPNLPIGTRVEREVGSLHHQDSDAKAFVRWGFDLIKVDACGIADFGPDVPEVRIGMYRALGPAIARGRPGDSDTAMVQHLYSRFAEAIRRASNKRPPIVSICAWGEADVNDWASKYGQMWRTSADINASWQSMLHNFDSAASRPLFAGPGRWNDPDMLEIGNGEFDRNHLTEARAHMSMWAIAAAPLILGYDITVESPEILAIVRNRDVIAVDQDPAGNQGVILHRSGDGEIVVKALARAGQKAVAFINRGEKPLRLSAKLADLNLSPNDAIVHDLWRKTSSMVRHGVIEVSLAPRETALVRIEARIPEANIRFPADMPARIRVSEPGFRPKERTTSDQWVPAQIGFLPSGERIATDGRPEVTALGVAAGSTIVVELNREFRRIRLRPDQAAAGYAIKGDGVILRRGTTASTLELNVRGVRRLELIAPPSAPAVRTYVWRDVSFQL